MGVRILNFQLSILAGHSAAHSPVRGAQKKKTFSLKTRHEKGDKSKRRGFDTKSRSSLINNNNNNNNTSKNGPVRVKGEKSEVYAFVVHSDFQCAKATDARSAHQGLYTTVFVKVKTTTKKTDYKVHRKSSSFSGAWPWRTLRATCISRPPLWRSTRVRRTARA